ncbi:peptidase M16C associated [Clostridium tepidiprofundi DSM 19306]|uniref:Peptidase M16C associated n=1 Tax=Clostridium tepidiprofundi DSM 19306 TaxID=1121338 RepID=A0A151B542_9CLOT|nr:insulinase family protein [Clostridium tepidiprofundi]KYH34882.1 peptidase M16C associated [Clostridium tepidiprofundi DSM 19306]
MKFEINKVYHGFKLIEEKEVKELNSIGRIFEHEKSGARLFQLQNDDDNKFFSIAFRTPPEDSTGLPHILEHSVLCGSRKFPMKEPFVELLKGSLNTFLNAMTFPDKTMYPVASRNEKDFFNLMDVYLDAVFYPNLINTPEILMQEGWHYEIEDKNDDITYKGVVYNEMKGAFSSPEGVLMRKIQESLFEDTVYSNESGGDPEEIPKLTQERFVEFHKKYYHPSNSYIFLYGDGDLDKQLEFINDNYLKDFDRITVDSEINYQKPYEKMKTVEEFYPISIEDSENDKTFLSMNFVTGKSTDPEVYFAMEILEYLLLENSAAPLKKALVDAELGKDVFGQFDSSILQPTFSVIIKNSNEDKSEKFKKVVFETLNKLVEDGIDKKLIEACINITEFKLREADLGGYPKGLHYNMCALDSWLYNGSPFTNLEYDSILNKIKSALTTDYFEELIKKYLLYNNHSTMLILKPKKGMAEEKDRELKQKLKDYKASLSEKEIEKLVEQTLKLKKRQITPDSKEDLETIPMVSIDDIDKKAEEIPQQIKEENGVNILYHNIFTSGIAYIDLYFDTSMLKRELIPYINLLSGILGKISTEKSHYSELSNEININTGGIQFTSSAFGDVKYTDKFYPKFIVKSKVLPNKIPQLMNLLHEIISTSNFDDKKRIKEIIQQMKSREEMKIFERGHIVAANRVMSYFSHAGRYMDELNGLGFYKFITNLEKNYETMSEEIINNLKEVYNTIFNKNNLVVSITSEETEYADIIKNLSTMTDKLKTIEFNTQEYLFDIDRKNEGLLTSGNVQYVAKGYNFKKLGYKYDGTMLVLKTIINMDYLWNKVRVQGGAYGCFMRVTKGGTIGFSSYRDPNLKETLNVYDNTVDYVKNIELSEREMTKYIIGTISELDQPLTPSMKGERASTNFFRNISQEYLQNERDNVLNVNVEKLKKFADVIEDIVSKDYYCVLGNETKIKENKDIFKELVTVFE